MININDIKKSIKSHNGKKVKITINGSRNRVEEYDAIITDAYKFIFVVEKEDSSIKSFTYTDILTKSVCIDFLY